MTVSLCVFVIMHANNSHISYCDEHHQPHHSGVSNSVVVSEDFYHLEGGGGGESRPE